MKGPLGYGRYDDDPNHVGCPRAKTDMTPCIARDGRLALSSSTALFPSIDCIGCQCTPKGLLRQLLDATDGAGQRIPVNPHVAADQLRDLVREVTEP